MTAPDLTAAAIEAGAEALWNWTMNDDVAVDPEPWRLVDSEDRQRCTEAVRIILEAAVPVLLDSHEKQVRERIAREIKAATGLWCPTCGCHVHIRHEGKRHCINDHEWDVSGIMNAHEAIAIARGSRPAADSGGEL